MKRTLTLLTALLLVPLAAVDAGRDLPGFPTTGKPRAQNFKSLENSGALVSDDWDWRIK